MPLEQFSMSPMVMGLTNISIYLTMVTGVAMMLMMKKEMSMKGESLMMMKEMCMNTMKSMMKEQIESGGESWVGLMYGVWMFMFMSNMMGLMPYSFTCTSSMKLTLSLSISMLIGMTMIGMKENKLKMLALMVPAGTPMGLVPLLVVMETMSYMTRGMSLGVSLGANMMAGHLLLKMMSGFMNKMKLVWWIPLMLLSVLMVLEMCIGVLQSMVYMLLVCTYMKDVMWEN